MTPCSKAHLEPSQTSTIQPFCEKSYRLLAINYLYDNGPLLTFDWALNTPLLLIAMFIS